MSEQNQESRESQEVEEPQPDLGDRQTDKSFDSGGVEKKGSA